MVNHILITATLVFFLGTAPVIHAQKSKQGTTSTAKNEVKFLEDITINIPIAEEPTAPVSGPRHTVAEPAAAVKKTTVPSNELSIENAQALQFKYAVLMNMEVEEIRNLRLFQTIDEWLGTRYKLGGSTKDGIDCSAFTQILFQSLYNIGLPRTAREQYGFARRISRAELKEGDLVFFNTIGGVSHVGMYLRNNKFVHASSGGVTISDLFEDYWMKHFVGVGRVQESSPFAFASKP